jgi:hypothetical protein
MAGDPKNWGVCVLGLDEALSKGVPTYASSPHILGDCFRRDGNLARLFQPHAFIVDFSMGQQRRLRERELKLLHRKSRFGRRLATTEPARPIEDAGR